MTNMKSVRVVVAGASGRMGSQVVSLLAGDRRLTLAAKILHRTSPEAAASALAGADVLIDFTEPRASVALAAAAAAARTPAVIGTTGFSPAQRRALERHARRIPLFVAPNFSVGVHVLCALAARAARALAAFDAGVAETHHAAKRDAPSGTALRLAAAVRAARGGKEAVPAVSLRLGDVVGEHTLTLAGPFERLELTHRAHSRAVFARGALEAALWLRGRKPGLYGMHDMLGGV